MISFRKPSDDVIRSLIERETTAPFTYPQVGASRGEPPTGYKICHRRARLGDGPDVFDRACNALRQWKMFRVGWVELCWPEAPVVAGTVVGVLIHADGLWSLNSARVVYVLDEHDRKAEMKGRFGFAYGTLPEHAEIGEERFSIEWLADNSVWYDLYSFSRPRHWVARLGGPVTRYFQRRFGTDSLAAMIRCVTAD